MPIRYDGYCVQPNPANGARFMDCRTTAEVAATRLIIPSEKLRKNSRFVPLKAEAHELKVAARIRAREMERRMPTKPQVAYDHDDGWEDAA